MADRSEAGAWRWNRCYACGHRLAFEANACPQCGEYFDGRRLPVPFPDSCLCDRCLKARAAAPEAP